MNERWITEHNLIAWVYVRFDDTDEGKYRPVLLINQTKGTLVFLKLTSQFANKSKYIQSLYLNFKRPASLGLTNHKTSYIDLGHVVIDRTPKSRPNITGHISKVDADRINQKLNELYTVKALRKYFG